MLFILFLPFYIDYALILTRYPLLVNIFSKVENSPILCENRTMIIAIDTGGTKTLLAGFSKEGKILKSFEFQTSKNTQKYLEITEKIIKKEFSKEFEGKEISAISIAAPGIVNDGIVDWAQNLGWQNFEIQKSFENIFPSSKILVDNDANLAGLFEAQKFKNSHKNVLYLTFSTGIGSGFISNGKINQELKNSEVGRIPIEFDGRIREWESFASARAIFNTYGKYASEITSPRQWINIADRMSRGFFAIIPILQPEIIIIGGSLGEQFEKFHVFLEQLIRDKLPAHIPCPKIIQAEKPREAVIYGCYEAAKRFSK